MNNHKQPYEARTSFSRHLKDHALTPDCSKRYRNASVRFYTTLHGDNEELQKSLMKSMGRTFHPTRK